MLVQYEGAEISLYLMMAMRFVDAAGDLPGVDCASLHYRFLGSWLKRGRPTNYINDWNQPHWRRQEW